VFRNGKAIGTKSTSTTYADQPPPGASYTYRVRSIDASGTTSAFSASITVEVPNSPDDGTDTTPPTTPAGLTAVSMSSRHIYLSWAASTDNSGGAISYNVYRDTTLVATVTTPALIDQPSSAGTYAYTVRALDASGNRSPLSSSVRGYAVN
jgi:fibronectin type 3 domain-containing protein